MKISSLALLIFIIRSAETVNVKEHNELRARAITEHHASDSEYHVDTVTAVRQKRAGSDPFTEYHSKMTLAARIFSGIALRIGLHDGSVSGDEVVSELLNLPPSLHLDDVANFDKAKVDQLFRDLAGLNLDTQNGRVTELEAKIRTMDQLRVQYEKIANTDDTSGIDDYIGKVKTFADANVDVSFLPYAGSTITYAVDTSLRKLRDEPASSIQQSDLVTLATQLNDFAKLPQQIETLLMTLNDNHKALLSNDIMDAAIVKDVELVREFFKPNSNSRSIAATVPPEFKNLLTSINGLAAKFDAVSSHLELILHIGRFESTSRLPSGFIHGLSDVLKISSDVVDPWLPGAIPKYDSALVKSGLQPLDQFRSSFAGLQTKWKSLDDARVRSQLLKIGETFNRSRSQSDAAAFAAIEGKQMPQVNEGFAQKVTTLVENILKFRATLIDLISKLKSIGKMDELHRLKELTRFKDDIDFSNNQKLSDVLQKMPDATKIDKLIDVLKVLQPKFLDIGALLNGAPLTTLPTKIEQNKGDIGVFLSDNDKKTVFDYFNFLKTLKTHLESLSESVDLVHTIRAIKSDANFQSELETVTSTISASISDFKALRAVPAAINSTQMPRIDEFVQLKGLEGPSKTFGEAVMVLDTAHQILKKKADIEQMMTAGWNVAGLIASSPDKKKLEKEWGDFGEIAFYFGQLLAELEGKATAMTGTRRKRQTDSLKDMAAKLANLQGLQDLKIDLKPRIGVLEQLTGLTNGAQLQSTLKSLAQLDMNFSSHQTALGAVVQEVDTAAGLFGATTNTISTPIPGNARGGNAPKSKDPTSSGLSVSGSVHAEKEDNSARNWTIGGSVAGVVVLLTAAFGGSMYLYRKKKKPLPQPDEQPLPDIKHSGSMSDENVKKLGDASKKLDELVSKSAKAKKKVEEQFDMSKLSEGKRKVANEYKDCVQVMMEVKRLEKKGQTNKELAKETEKKMAPLKEQLGVQLAKDVEKVAKLEYETMEQMVVVALLRLEVSKKYDDGAMVAKKTEQLNKMLLTPLDMCREKKEWTLVRGVWRPPPRPKEYCQFVLDMLLSFDPLESVIKPNRSTTLIGIPYLLRLLDANQLVDDMKLSYDCVKKFHDEAHPTIVKCFDVANVKLSTGREVNATFYKPPYDATSEMVICASPGYFNAFEDVDQMLWDKKPAYTVSVDVPTLYYEVERPAIAKFHYSQGSEEVVERDPRRNWCLKKRTIRMFYGSETHTMLHYSLHVATDHQNHQLTAENFRRWVKEVLRAVGRRPGKCTVYFDNEGSCYAGTVAGIELISSSLSHDGVAAVDVTTQLVKILSRRGGMFTQPDQVMFMIFMAVEMFLEDHKMKPLTKEHFKWLEMCNDKQQDFVFRVKKFGETKALDVAFEDDATIGSSVASFGKSKPMEPEMNTAKCKAPDYPHEEGHSLLEEYIIRAVAEMEAEEKEEEEKKAKAEGAKEKTMSVEKTQSDKVD